MKKIILSILVLALVGAAGVYYYAFVYSKNRKIDMVNAEAMTIDVNTLVKAFQENELEAGKSYVNKVVLIEAKVSATEISQAGERIVSLSSDDPFYGIVVTLDSAEVATVNINDKVAIKGVCQGFLNTDVRITNAILVK
jgi:hypothetical protein